MPLNGSRARGGVDKGLIVRTGHRPSDCRDLSQEKVILTLSSVEGSCTMGRSAVTLVCVSGSGLIADSQIESRDTFNWRGIGFVSLSVIQLN